MPTPDSGGSWGILGGNFDPVHNGHLHLAKSIHHKKNLNGVLLIPALKHPFKSALTLASYSDRVAMLKLALEKETTLQLSEIEREENLSGYTIDTIRALKKRFPKAAFHFIIGLDLVPQLKDWHRSEELINETHFLAGSRPGTEFIKMARYTGKAVEYVEIDKIDISASDIRTRVKNGANISEIKELVPQKAAEYIFQKGLYR